MLKFRRITSDDYEAVAPLMLELHNFHAEGRPDVFRTAAMPTYEEFCERVAGGDKIALCAESSGKIIAYTVVRLKKSTGDSSAMTAWMDDIYVIPSERRGRVGTMLYRMAERAARERGAERLDLCVWCFNEDAAAFYRKCGFAPQRIVLEKDITVENFERECGG